MFSNGRVSALVAVVGLPLCFGMAGGMVGGMAGSAGAQVFTALDAIPDAPLMAWTVPGPRPVVGAGGGAVVFADHAALVAALAGAPIERVGVPLSEYGVRFSLPGPDGLVECFVAESPVMEPALAAWLDGQGMPIKTYIAQSVDGKASGRFEVAPRGLTAMLRTVDGLERGGGAWMVDPAWSADSSVLLAYWTKDLPSGGNWSCGTDPEIHTSAHAGHGGGGGGGGFGERAVQNRRVARVAMACTGEYGVHHSLIQGRAPNAADPMAAIVTVIARVNVVYEADIGVHFDLVANNNLVVFFNPDTDPYPTTCDGLGGGDCSGPILGANQQVLFDTFWANGGGGYDIGHAVTRIAGGVAYLYDVCGTGGGVSGIPRGGDADPYSALVVIHEFGHQFGANHTFSGTRGRCGNNARLASAWEAGSGSSPMAYAGGCPVGDAPPSDNIVQFADPFFHHGSVEEMKAFLPNASCLSTTATANRVPEIVSVTPNQAIPPGTPFTLSAIATDADADTLTYSWEQFDNGERRPLEGDGSADNGNGSLFRIFPPVTSPARTFPKMADVLSGVPTAGEKLPTVTNATRRFRLVVRDNSTVGVGASAISPLVSLTIAGSGPFAVTTPSQGQSVSGPGTITWSVGGTNVAPISRSQVTVRLSTDSGVTFPTTLGTFANTGTANVTFPNQSSAAGAARVRIDPVGGAFFAMSRPFTLVNACPPDFNGDGFLDFFDYDAFVTSFETGTGPSADFNGDGFVDFFDYDAYVAAFEAGC
jgi:hypothetical protein